MPWLSHTFFCQEGKRSEQLPTMNPNSLALRTISTVTPPAGSPNSIVPSMSKLMRKANFRPPRAYTAPTKPHISPLSHALPKCPVALPHERRGRTGSAYDRLPQYRRLARWALWHRLLVLTSPVPRQGRQPGTLARPRSGVGLYGGSCAPNQRVTGVRHGSTGDADLGLFLD